MALSFNEVEGKAKSSKVDYYKFEEGDNEFRMVGGVLARYVYWHKTPTGGDIAMECLEFNRDKEEFDKGQKDWFSHYFPEVKCKWAYVVQVYNKAGKLKVLALRKKMFESIKQNAAKHWGDPTDPATGMKLVVSKKKTGPKAFNVEYEVDVLACKPQPLTKEQIAELEEKPSIDALFPRQTSDEQKANIERIWFATNEAVDNDDLDDDIPF